MTENQQTPSNHCNLCNQPIDGNELVATVVTGYLVFDDYEGEATNDYSGDEWLVHPRCLPLFKGNNPYKTALLGAALALANTAHRAVAFYCAEQDNEELTENMNAAAFDALSAAEPLQDEYPAVARAIQQIKEADAADAIEYGFYLLVHALLPIANQIKKGETK